MGSTRLGKLIFTTRHTCCRRPLVVSAFVTRSPTISTQCSLHVSASRSGQAATRQRDNTASQSAPTPNGSRIRTGGSPPPESVAKPDKLEVLREFTDESLAEQPPAVPKPTAIPRRTGTMMNLDQAAKFKLVDEYSHFNPTPMSIKQFLEFGQMLTTSGKEICGKTSFQFLRRELPVRLANIMKEIHLLPESLLAQSSTQIVQRWYEQSFFEVLQYDSADGDDATTIRKFTADLIKIRNRHANVVETMAQGVVELKQSRADEGGVVDSATRTSIQYFLDRFYMMRISIRMLINQHTILFGEETPSSSRFIGTIDPECDLQMVVNDAYDNARSLCEQYYSRAPELQIQCINSVKEEHDRSPKIVYVPSHLYHISFELFKNSMRALCERTEEHAKPAPITVTVVKSAEDVAIKLSDVGGGIPQKDMPRLFEYMFSTAPTPVGNDSMTNVVPMAGYGYGLPLSRLYARYFHGDLQVYSMHGHGTDAVIYLKTLSENASELLPVYNKSVLRAYKNARTHGWSSSASKFSQTVEWG